MIGEALLTKVFEGGVSGVFNGIGGLIQDVRSAWTGEISPDQKAEIEKKLLEIEFIANKAQTDINLQEARHPNIFVSGWRPFIGWVCGVAIAYNFIVHPVVEWVCTIYAVAAKPPVLDTGNLMTLVFSLLGLGSMRTYEKLKGVNKSH